jgi:hypothetical protein
MSLSLGRSCPTAIVLPLIRVTNVSLAKQPEAEDEEEADADAEADEPKTN